MTYWQVLKHVMQRPAEITNAQDLLVLIGQILIAVSLVGHVIGHP